MRRVLEKYMGQCLRRMRKWDKQGDTACLFGLGHDAMDVARARHHAAPLSSSRVLRAPSAPRVRNGQLQHSLPVRCNRSHTLRSDSVLKELLLQRRACLFGQLDSAATPSGIHGHYGARACHGDAEAP